MTVRPAALATTCETPESASRGPAQGLSMRTARSLRNSRLRARVDRALGDDEGIRASRNASRVMHVRHAEGDIGSVLLAEWRIAGVLDVLARGLAHRGAKRRSRRTAGLLQRAYDVSSEGGRNLADLACDCAYRADGRPEDRPKRPGPQE